MKNVYVVCRSDSFNCGDSNAGIEGVYKEKQDAINAMKNMFISEIQDQISEESGIEFSQKENGEDYTDDEIEKIAFLFEGWFDGLSLQYTLYDNIYKINISEESLR